MDARYWTPEDQAAHEAFCRRVGWDLSTSEPTHE